MTKNDDKRVPALRFKGFNDDWAQRLLKHFITVSSQKNLDNSFDKFDVLSVSGKYGIVNQIKFQGRSFAGKTLTNYKVVNTNDVVYTKSPIKNNPYGVIKVNKHKSGIVSTLYAVYNPTKYVCSNFVELYFNDNLRLNKYLKPIVNIGAKHDMKIANKEVINHNVIFPEVEEQRQICTLFLKLEKLISLQQRKLKQVELLKKYLLQNLFPTKNEKNAKLLFKGHKEIWREQKANDIFTEVDTRKVPDNTILSTTQNGKVVPRNSLGRNLVFSTSKLKNYKLVRSGQFIIHLRSFKGGFATSSLTGIVSPTYTIFDFKNRTKHDTKFWSILFTNYNFIQSLKSVTEGIRYNGIAIKFSQFSDLKISFPQLSTQMDISKIINCLNLSLEKQKLKIQELQKTKQFLLQNMFI